MSEILTKTVERFLYVESAQIPLTEIPFAELKQTIIDPTTGLPYKGMILKGCFADLSNKSANNNYRFYDVPKYLELLQILKKQIHSAKGVYGEYEHPKSYAVHGPSISHKIIDVWYDEKTQMVYGIVLLLNTIQGLKAQEIIKSGGQLAISGRAAGTETDNPDGTKLAVTKILTTYDLVYHPGFSSALLQFVELNESQKIIQNIAKTKTGFSGILYEKDLRNIHVQYTEFVDLNENSKCFYEWLLESVSEQNMENKKLEKNSNDKAIPQETKAQQQQQQQILQDNEASDEEQVQDQLQQVTDQQLKESQNLLKNKMLVQMNEAQQKAKLKLINNNGNVGNKQAKSFYDGSAGFKARQSQSPQSSNV